MRLVVDANILIGELLRKRGRELIKNPDLDLYISQRVFSEANHELSKRIKVMVEKGKFEFYLGEIILKEAKLIIDNFITTIPLADYQHLEKEAVNRIPRDPDDIKSGRLTII